MSATNQSSTQVSNAVEIIDSMVDKEALEICNLLRQNLTSAELKAKLLEMGDDIQFYLHFGDEESVSDIEWRIPAYKEVLRCTLEKETYEAAIANREVSATQLALYYSSHTSQPWEAPRYGDGTIDCSSVQCYCDGSCGSYDSY